MREPSEADAYPGAAVTWLALGLALQAHAPSPAPPAPLRLINRPDLHLGVRPAALVSPSELAVGVTVQFTVHAL